MYRIAAMALAFGLAATPVLAAEQSTGPERLSDSQLAEVTGGGTLPLNLDDLLHSIGQNLGLNLDLTNGPINVTLGGIQGTAGTLVPLIQQVATLTGQLIQQAQAMSAAQH